MSTDKNYLINMKNLLLVITLLFSPFAQADSLNIAVDDETEIPVQTFNASGDSLYIWLPSEAGFLPNEYQSARTLQQRGISVWFANTLEARFLPTAPSSLLKIPDSDVQALIDYALQNTSKTIYLVAQGRGVISVLRGVARWQQTSANTRFGGSILISPQLFVATPDPGVAANLMPIVSSTNQALFIIQPALSPWWWKQPITIPELRKAGSDVYHQTLSGVRDRFYYRPDATAQEQATAQLLPDVLAQAGFLLRSFAGKRAFRQQLARKAAPTIEKKDRRLRAYQGNPAPPELRLLDMQGQTIDLQAMRGKVVLLNFWASWCPPCVHEMPSMQRLYDKFSRDQFEILAVNMAEDKATIQQFLQKRVAVNFPVLLDTDGAALRRWQVFAFPTSYVIGPNGNIRYALFGAVDWDNAEIVAQIKGLLQK